MRRVGLGKEIPSAKIGEPISKRQLEGYAILGSLKERLALELVLQHVLGISSCRNVVVS